MFNEHVLLEGFIFPEEDREKVASAAPPNITPSDPSLKSIEARKRYTMRKGEAEG
jgi:hypothetical protein